MAARKLSGGQALNPATPRLPGLPVKQAWSVLVPDSTGVSVTAGTAGRRCGRHRWDGWATNQRPAGRGGTDMATTPNLITRAVRKQALEERGLIRSQMRLGAGLIALGALSIPLFQVSGVLEGQAATAAFAVATAVIGAGAAMLPTGAPQAPAPPSCGRSQTRTLWPTTSTAPPAATRATARSGAGVRRALVRRARHPRASVTCPVPCVSFGPTRMTLTN